jgi:hypothetical protein
MPASPTASKSLSKRGVEILQRTRCQQRLTNSSPLGPHGVRPGAVVDGPVALHPWLSMPDPTTAISALGAGEIDYLQNPRSRCGRIKSCCTSTAGSGSSSRPCGRMSRGWGRRRGWAQIFSSQASTPLLPLISIWPRGSKAKRSLSLSYTDRVTWIVPGTPPDSMRLARFTVSPQRS